MSIIKKIKWEGPGWYAGAGIGVDYWIKLPVPTDASVDEANQEAHFRGLGTARFLSSPDENVIVYGLPDMEL